MMLALAHVGITLVVAKGLEKVMASWGAYGLARAIDYRLVLVGSMLPDIIDKPLGGIILKETLGNGRIYSHTLVFLFCLLGVGLFAWLRWRRLGLLTLGGGSIVHHILDGMWLYPNTYLWPVFGWGFPKGDPEGWLQLWISNLLADPLVFVPEIVGGVVLCVWVVGMFSRAELKRFILTGKLG